MDDNLLWPEWLAYHYQVLPLPRMIVALDPKSTTRPTELFDRYRQHGLPLSVTVWENDEFIHKKFHNASETTKHRLRQRVFLHRCLEQLHAEGRSWVLLIDTEEYLVPQWPNLIGSEGDTNNHVLDVLTSRMNEVFSVDLNADYSQWLGHIDLGCMYLFRYRFMPANNETSPTPGLPIRLRTAEQHHFYSQNNPKVMLDLSKLSPAKA